MTPDFLLLCRVSPSISNNSNSIVLYFLSKTPGSVSHFGYFLMTVTKCPTKVILRRRRVWTGSPFLMASRHRQQQEPEAAGRISLVVREQRKKNAGAQFTFSSLRISLRPIEWCCSHSRRVFLPQLNLPGYALTDRPTRMCVSHINI